MRRMQSSRHPDVPAGRRRRDANQPTPADLPALQRLEAELQVDRRSNEKRCGRRSAVPMASRWICISTDSVKRRRVS